MQIYVFILHSATGERLVVGVKDNKQGVPKAAQEVIERFDFLSEDGLPEQRFKFNSLEFLAQKVIVLE